MDSGAVRILKLGMYRCHLPDPLDRVTNKGRHEPHVPNRAVLYADQALRLLLLSLTRSVSIP